MRFSKAVIIFKVSLFIYFIMKFKKILFCITSASLKLIKKKRCVFEGVEPSLELKLFLRHSLYACMAALSSHLFSSLVEFLDSCEL